MASILKWLKLLSDPTRVRIIRLLRGEKLLFPVIQIRSQIVQFRTGVCQIVCSSHAPHADTEGAE